MTPPERGVSGQYAGAVSRLTAYVVDTFLITVTFGFLVAAASYVIGLVSDVTVNDEGWWVLVGYATWWFLYMWVGLTVAGRTVGMLLTGIKVVARAGRPLSPLAAFVRVLTFPLSFLLFGLGFIGIVVGRERRALHDVLAGAAVVYDWGDRPAELPAPLARWIAEHQPTTVP